MATFIVYSLTQIVCASIPSFSKISYISQIIGPPPSSSEVEKSVHLLTWFAVVMEILLPLKFLLLSHYIYMVWCNFGAGAQRKCVKGQPSQLSSLWVCECVRVRAASFILVCQRELTCFAYAVRYCKFIEIPVFVTCSIGLTNDLISIYIYTMYRHMYTSKCAGLSNFFLLCILKACITILPFLRIKYCS